VLAASGTGNSRGGARRIAAGREAEIRERRWWSSVCQTFSISSTFVAMAAVGESCRLAPLLVVDLPRVRMGEEEHGERREEQMRNVKEGKQYEWTKYACPHS